MRGHLDECGVCNGPGAIVNADVQTSLLAIATATATKLDALGVCGGDCAADADNDGICDDIDDCVGQYDATWRVQRHVHL